MFVRFVILRHDPDSRQKQGIFLIADDLRRWADLTPHEQIVLDDEIAWFDDNIPVPRALKQEGSDRAITWFRPTATEAIARVRRICEVLEEHGYHTEMLTIENPGTILYDDEWQVVAFPPRPNRRPSRWAER